MEKVLDPVLYYPPLDQESYGSRDLETSFHNEQEIHSYIPLSKHILWICAAGNSEWSVRQPHFLRPN